jgi:hypothetical protein
VGRQALIPASCGHVPNFGVAKRWNVGPTRARLSRFRQNATAERVAATS